MSNPADPVVPAVAAVALAAVGSSLAVGASGTVAVGIAVLSWGAALMFGVATWGVLRL